MNVYLGNSSQKEEGGPQNGDSRWQKAPVLLKETWGEQHLWYRGGGHKSPVSHLSVPTIILSLRVETCFDPFQVNMFTNQGTVIHFNNPKVQASLAANTFTITGHAETKQLTEMLPGILNQLGADSLTSLRRLAEALPKQGEETQRSLLHFFDSAVFSV